MPSHWDEQLLFASDYAEQVASPYHLLECTWPFCMSLPRDAHPACASPLAFLMVAAVAAFLSHGEQMRAGIVAARAYSSGLTEALVVPYMRSVSEQVRMLCSDARSEDIDRWLASTLSRLEAQSVVAAASASTADASGFAVSSSSSSSISSSNSSNDGGVGVVEGKVPTAEVVTSSEVNAPSAAPLDEDSDTLVARARAELPALLLRFFRTGFEVRPQ